MEIKPEDIVVSTFRTGSAWFPRDNGVSITHIPTGIVVSSDTERSQHANKAKALDKLEYIFKDTRKEFNMNKPTIGVSRKQLEIEIKHKIETLAFLTDKMPSTNEYVRAITDIIAVHAEFGKDKIVKGDKVVIISGFSKGSKGVVDFVEPLANGKYWVTRNGDSSPKFWMEHELELISAK